MLEVNRASPDIDCPGDRTVYNCSILSNSEDVHLTWHIDDPELNITYSETSTLNTTDDLNFNISSSLTKYISDVYIESIISLTLLKNVMNGTLVKCSIDPNLDSDSMIMSVNTSGK